MRSLLALTISLSLAAPAAATTFQVNPTGSGDYPTIQAAIDACAAGDTVLCAPGTYTGDGNRGLDFHGVDLVLRSSGGSEATVLEGEYSYAAMIFESGESRAAVVEGLTLTHFGGGQGGNAIKCWDGSPTLRDLRLIENSSWGDLDPLPGAGLACYGGSPLLEDVVFQGNVGKSAAHFGDCAEAELRHVEFSGGNWGGLSLEAVPALLEDVLFAECSDYPALAAEIVDRLVLDGSPSGTTALPCAPAVDDSSCAIAWFTAMRWAARPPTRVSSTSSTLTSSWRVARWRARAARTASARRSPCTGLLVPASSAA